MTSNEVSFDPGAVTTVTSVFVSTPTSGFASTSSPSSSAPASGSSLTGAGPIVGFVILGLYVLFQVTVIVLILCNKIRTRRNRKKLAASVGYNSLGSDLELGDRSKTSNCDDEGLPQLPTDEEGGEDLDGKAKIQIDGTPVYQLGDSGATWTGRISTSRLRDGMQQVDEPHELPGDNFENATKRPNANGEQSQLRRPTSSVIIDINTSTGVNRRESVVSTANTVVIDGVRVRDV